MLNNRVAYNGHLATETQSASVYQHAEPQTSDTPHKKIQYVLLL